MKLVWDSSQYKITFNDLEIDFSGANKTPRTVAAIVEEQDTALVLEPTDIISDYGDDKPLWYVANTRKLQKSHSPGTVIVKSGSPIKLQAIIHDLDHSPSWKKKWISRALDQVFKLCNEKQLSSIALPVLGAQFGQFRLEEFISLLAETLTTKRCHFPVKINLILDTAQHQIAYELLKARLLIP